VGQGASRAPREGSKRDREPIELPEKDLRGTGSLESSQRIRQEGQGASRTPREGSKWDRELRELPENQTRGTGSLESSQGRI
jgi:hypothetical protein